MSEEANYCGDKVVFTEVPGSYKPGESVTVRYRLYIGLVIHNRDWIGLFKVGWTSNRDYYTFEWAPFKKFDDEEGESDRVVKFTGSRLPPDDGNFYQFCYVTYGGAVKGASRPFQFSNATRNSYADDLEVIEVNEEDSLLLLRTRHEAEVSELQKRVEELTQNNVNVEATFVQVKTEQEQLAGEVKQLNERCEALKTELFEAKKDNDLKTQEILAQTTFSGQCKQKIDELSETVRVKDEEIELLQRSKDEMEQELGDVTVRVQQIQIANGKKNDDIKTLQNTVSALKAEKQAILAEKLEVETQLRTHCSQLEERQRELIKENEALEGRSEYYQAETEKQQQRMEVQAVQIGTLEQEARSFAHELEKEKSESAALSRKLAAKEQEVNVLQANMCEIAGNIKEPRDQLPPESETDKVDRSAIEALQMAYEDIEKRLKREQKINRSYESKIAEAEKRVQMCQEEYKRIATENVNLKKTLKKSGISSNGSNTPTTAGPNHQEEVVKLEQELEAFQLKHDERIAEKNEDIQKLTEEIKDLNDKLIAADDAIAGMTNQEEAMKRSIESLNVENEQLKRQLRERPIANPPYPPHANPPPYHVDPRSRPVHIPPPQRPHTQQPRRPQTNDERVCPICSVAYPSRIPQAEYERHVNSHFQ